MTNIALVDDESNILTSVSLALETEGFNVDTFNNGEEAIQVSFPQFSTLFHQRRLPWPLSEVFPSD